ncbi:hypothetical protein AVEN_254695-1 [Araneus ventricosus]|uniref:Uncharacterized protein n=1 Tax=Araneus ventricosus TaxID=182803 RepID=A0A4Y2USQ6_ARAVE|nr:hypothetical protein AVEN_254695-1 [Araneus ventricosus]
MSGVQGFSHGSKTVVQSFTRADRCRETAEASDEEEGNNNILSHDNDELPCNTASEIEAHSARKFDPLKVAVIVRKNIKNRNLKWIKKDTTK